MSIDLQKVVMMHAGCPIVHRKKNHCQQHHASAAETLNTCRAADKMDKVAVSLCEMHLQMSLFTPVYSFCLSIDYYEATFPVSS